MPSSPRAPTCKAEVQTYVLAMLWGHVTLHITAPDEHEGLCSSYCPLKKQDPAEENGGMGVCVGGGVKSRSSRDSQLGLNHLCNFSVVQKIHLQAASCSCCGN